ncbi:hypothetical protein Droror1_Dr00003108 [Drosera rotundifolia]
MLFVASFIYLLGFFGIDFVQSIIISPNHHHEDEEDIVRAVDVRSHRFDRSLQNKPDLDLRAVDDRSRRFDRSHQKQPDLELDDGDRGQEMSVSEDEAMVETVADGSVASHSLESKLGDCGELRNKEEYWDNLTQKYFRY